MLINLESIKEYFPYLKRFIARLTNKEVDLISEKNETDVDSNEVIKCFSKLWIPIAFGENYNRYDIEIPIEYVKAFVEWLGEQSIKDTDILLNKLNMIDDLDTIDIALYQLYKVVDDALLELEEV